MDLETREEMRTQLLGYLDNHTTDYADDVMYVPTSNYTDPAYLEKEYDRVFCRYPEIVAHHSELEAEPGSFLRVNVTGTDVLVVRQDDGSVKAMSNACRHRGTAVELADCGRRRTFSCPYHRWTYNRDGSLRSVPFDDGFIGIDRDDFGLVEYPAEVYAGLIWVSPKAGTDPLDMAGYFGEQFDKEIRESGIESSFLYRKQTFDLDFNWKAVMDGYTDAYHLQFVHPTTVGPLFHTNIYKSDIFGKHRRMTTARKGIEDARDADLATENFAKLAIYGWQIHPGIVISRPPAHWEVEFVRPDPDDLSRCKVTLMMLVSEVPETEKSVRFREKNWDMLMHAVVDEDWVVAGTINDAVASGSVDRFVFGRNEKSTQHLHKTLAEDIVD